MVFTVFLMWQVCYRIHISKCILSGVPEHAATRHCGSFRYLPATSHKDVWPRKKIVVHAGDDFSWVRPVQLTVFSFHPRSLRLRGIGPYARLQALLTYSVMLWKRSSVPWPRKKVCKNTGTDVFSLCSFAKLYNRKIRTMKRNFNVFAIHNAPSRSIISKNNYTAAL